MTTLIEKYNQINVEDVEGHEIKVIKDSDVLYQQAVEWKQDIEYEEPTEYEKELLKDSIKSTELIELEKNEIIPEKTQEEIDKQNKEEYILKVKVIGISLMGHSIISNPSYWRHEKKQQLISEMQNIIDTYSNEEINETFNKVVNENLFDKNLNYDSFPLKRT
jgi:hypothetical protein